MANVTDNIKIESRDVKWLKDQSDLTLLEIDHSFQRQYIWTVKNQIRLIETILMGYPVPEIYLWEKETDSISGGTVHSIIDGQQRLGSIFDFVNNKFPLKKNYVDFKEADYVDKTFENLTDEQRTKIWQYPLSVRFIKRVIGQDDIVNMFLRLNSTSTTLNPQELRNAEYNGLFLRLANELSKLDIWENISLFTGNEYRRMRDIEFISSLLIFIRLGIEEETSQKNINKIYDTFNEEYADFESDKTLFELLIGMINELVVFDDSIKKFISRKVHFYTLFTALYYVYRKEAELCNSNLNNYKHFVKLYQSKGTLEENGNNINGLVNEYYALAQEGTQGKSNRLRRFEIIRDILIN